MASAVAAARRTVTVLFCDLTESTELGERLDPESLRGLLERWYEAMRESVERHGGLVEKFIGDAVMAVFGLPQVHEDDALRAVRAGVEMRDGLERLNAELLAEGRPGLRIRIGINTGEVVTGDGTTTLVTGDAVNTAKRLEEAASADEILIGATTRRLVENAAQLERIEPVAAKGKRDPVEAWRVLETIEGAEPFARRLDAPLVGRAHELALLRKELDTAIAGRECRLVTVFGVAGIGKSRLATELIAELGDNAVVLSARCLPYGDGISFLPLTELVQSAGGEETIRRAVEAELDGALIVERVSGSVDPDAAPPSSEETFWAIRRLFETLARERPVVVCVEDVHWAEPTFLDLLEHVAGWSRDAPILLLCLARPDLLDARPRWGGTAMALGPLTADESETLLDELGAEWPIPLSARPSIAEAAEGNPLFVEQMVAMLSEAGDTTAIPPSIQALLAARLDRLEPLERTVLERAAVVGKEFWGGAVLELSPADDRAAVSAALLSLVRKELVRPERSAFLGEDGFRFRHALICDAAYLEIPKRARADLHERFGAWLDAHDGEDELLGYHLEQSYRYRVELGISNAATDALAARAGTLLGDAGRRALSRHDAPAAANLLLRACELLRDDDLASLELQRRASVALWSTGRVDEATAMLERHIARAAERGAAGEEWSGRLEQASWSLMSGRTGSDELLGVAQQAIVVFEAQGDEPGLSRAWRRVAHAHMVTCQFGSAADAAEQALRFARSSDERFEEARIVDVLCSSLLFGPAAVDAAIARCEQMLVEASTSGALEANIAASLAGLYGLRASFDAAREMARRADSIYAALGLQLASAGLSQVVGPMELLAGDTAAAEREIRRGLAILEPSGAHGYQEVLLAQVLYEQGRLPEAAQHIEAGARNAAPDNVAAQVLWRGVRAKLEAKEAPTAALALAQDAVGLAEATESPNLLADALSDLAAVLRATASDDADETARRALELYERKGNLPSARRVADLLSTPR
jgi:class 3 adenylate cyclase/tetratricopeptide (TPR) repeat protein